MEKVELAIQNDAAACGRLWDIYVREAQAYDEGLIKSWKEDMDITLVFSGLYSAILTAFVIESYRNLQANPVEDSTVLLKRISQQLENPSDSSGLTPFPDSNEFSPTSSALACNILWFISLALALTCAFLATLVQQWSRRFLHRTSTVRSPSARAHLLQYLYFGLKDLNMHAMVDLIPSLLHLSLFSFFAGLIGFLNDVNGLLTALFVLFLGLVLFVYSTFTVLPIVNLASPYCTPLSPMVWRIWGLVKETQYSSPVQAAQNFLLRLKPRDRNLRPDEATMQESGDEESQLLPSISENNTLVIRPHRRGSGWSIVDASIRASQKRHHPHESRSITWTLGSLNDDVGLLSFLEVLPDVLLGGNLDSVRQGNLHLMDGLLATRDAQSNLVSRTLSLVENSKNPWYTNQHRERCSIACAKTLYSLARVLVDHKYRERFVHPATFPSLFSGAALERIEKGIRSNALEPSFANSALALCKLSIPLSLHDRIKASADQAIPLSWFQNAMASAFEHFGSTATVMMTIHPTLLPESFPQLQARAIITEMISAPFYCYLCDAIYKPSFNMVDVCKLMVQNGGDLSKFTGSLHPLFSALGRNIQRPNEPASVERMDTAFGIALDCVTSSMSTQIQRLENEQELILDYIASRFNGGGWGSTAGIWSTSDRLFRLLNYLQNPATSFFNSPHMPSSALQELLLHAIDAKMADVGSFLEHLFSKQNTLKTHLSYLHILLILRVHRRREAGMKPCKCISPLLEELNQEVHLKSRSNGILEDVPPEWVVLLHCLDSKIPLLQIRDILQFFYRCSPKIFNSDEVAKIPGFLSEMARHLEHFSVLLLQTPSREALDITAMLWSFLGDVFSNSGPSIDGEATQAAWSKLAPLSTLANKLLSPEGRRTLEHEIMDSTSEQQHTILTHSNLKRLNLIDMVELVQKQLTPIIHLLIPLPPAGPDEDTKLAIINDPASWPNHPPK